MASYVITDNANSFTIEVENNSLPYSRNDLRVQFSASNDQIFKILDKAQRQYPLYTIDLTQDSIDVGGTTSFADAQALFDAIEPIFFLASGGGGGGFTPVTTAETFEIRSGDWIFDSTRYYVDLSHNLGTKDLLIESFDIATNDTYVPDDYERTDDNTVRVWSTVNTIELDTIVSNGGQSVVAESYNIKTETGNFTPSSDGGTLYIVDSASDVTVTIDNGACSVGESILFKQKGLGQILLVEGTATLEASVSKSFKSLGESAIIGLNCSESDVYTVIGDTE